MRTSSAVFTLLAVAASFATAALHSDAVCIDSIGNQKVYNEALTIKACESYRNRNTGGEQWDQCPDCAMKVAGNLNVCHSDGWHIGGDEITYYCEKHGSSAGAMTN
ncbi:hypothetical protein GQ44DRAFT_777854 [Phaeosphaeriaceae sp. PMI808]|nr:hypothetical protein GQ44DRAFT_777854 [Phaeosphaeriaceae sp. PMI808]